MAAAAAQDFSGGVSDLHSQVPRHTARLLHHDQQFHRHQPFYIPNTHPVLPYQLPLSAPYVPYTGFPGLGYGMVMPSLVLPPCLDVSGYMLPHVQMHMLDYRRVMNPHVPPNISYQASRFRFQNGVSHNCVMVSSEVQTEPTCRSSAQDSHVGSESGRGTGCDSPVSVSGSFSENKSVACPKDTPVFINRVVASNTINTSDVSALHKREILLQAEQVQIKCSETPSRLQKICTSKNTRELTCNDAGDLLQCSSGSIRSDDVVLCSYRSLAIRKAQQGVEAEHLRRSSKHRLPVCKIHVFPSRATFKACPTRNVSNVNKIFESDKSSEMQRACNLTKTKQNSNFKILHLPFDTQTCCQLEASVWSVESLMPYVPSVPRSPKTPESHAVPIKKGSLESTKRLHQEFRKSRSPYGSPMTFNTQTCRQLEASMWSVESLVPCGDSMIRNGLVTPQKCPLVKNQHIIESTKYQFGKCSSPHRPLTNYSQLEASVWSVESLMPYVPPVLKTQKTPEGHAVPVEKNQHIMESTKRQEFLKCDSPYRPSTSWLADLGNVYYYSKLPALQQKLKGLGKSPEKKPVENHAGEAKQTNSSEFSYLKHEKERKRQRSSDRNDTCDQKKRGSCTDKNTAAVSCGRVSHYSRCSCETDRKLPTSHYRHSRRANMHHNTRPMVLGSHLMKLREQSDLCEDCRCLDDDDGDGGDEQNNEDCVSWRWRDAQRGRIQGEKNTSGQGVYLMNQVKAH